MASLEQQLLEFALAGGDRLHPFHLLPLTKTETKDVIDGGVVESMARDSSIDKRRRSTKTREKGPVTGSRFEMPRATNALLL